MAEKHIQKEIIDYLALLERQGKLYYHRANSGAIKSERGGYVRLGRAGMADIVVYLRSGKTLFLEIKTEKTKQSDSQKKFQNDISRLGFEYIVVRSLDQVRSIIE